MEATPSWGCLFISRFLHCVKAWTVGGVASASSTYQPRRPDQGALHQLVRDHFETFRAQAAHLRDGQGLPRFVEQEFRDFLTCGCLAAGFARFRCSDCRLDRLVHFNAISPSYFATTTGSLRDNCRSKRVEAPWFTNAQHWGRESR